MRTEPRQWLWFAAIWAASVIVALVAVEALRVAMKWAFAA